MTTSIIGVGNLGGTVARHLVAGGEPVALAASDEAHARALADELGPSASAASVEDAIVGSDTVVLATWLAQSQEYVPALASVLENKVVVDPSNPIGFENGAAVFGVYALVLLLALLVFGSLSDYVGRRPVIVAGLVLEIAATAVFLGAKDVGWLYVARILQGAAVGAVTAAFGAALIVWVPKTRDTLI